MNKIEVPDLEKQALLLWGILRHEPMLQQFRSMLGKSEISSIRAYNQYRIALEMIEHKYMTKLDEHIREAIAEVMENSNDE